VVDGATVGKLVFTRIKSPRLLSQVELLSKSNAKGLKISSAGNFVAEIELKLHLFNSDD